MSQAIENLMSALQKAMKERPPVGGFPYLAETLRRAGVRRNVWLLPSCQSMYFTDKGPVITQNTPLVSGPMDVPKFDREELIAALRADQSGKTTFPQFLEASWRAGVVRYEVDFTARSVSYYGFNEEVYVEDYPMADVKP